MSKHLNYSILCGALLAISQVAVLPADSAKAPITRKDELLVTVTASVESIDLPKREVTLKGPLGNTTTFTVDQRVKRLNEVKVGDFVRADYYISFAAELRKPTPEEEKTPLVVLDAAGKAPAGSSPAAGGLRRFRVVTTIEGVDRSTQTVTVKGPMGNTLTARVANLENLTKMQLGEKIIITYTEALAISLEKLEKKSLD